MKSKYLIFLFLIVFSSLSLNAIGSKPSLDASSDSPAIKILKQVSDGFSEISEKSIPAVVSIKAVFEQPQTDPAYDDFFYHFFGPMPQNPSPSIGFGTGFFITNDGYILTNNHLVKNTTSLKVRLQDGREYDAKVIGTDPSTEVALVKVDGKNFPFLKLADSEKVRVGELAIAIGNPFEFEASVTVGVISAKGRNTNGTAWENYIQTDAPINPGNSGGPLLNVNGDVIGINTAILSKSGGYMGIGFAIPSNIAEHIADQFLKHGHIIRGYLGIKAQTLTPDVAEALDIDSTSGYMIVEVSANSPAQKAGLQEQDVILKINGKNITHQTNFTHEISLMQPGTKVNFTVNRDGKLMDIKVTIGNYPNTPSLESPIAAVNKLGIEVENLNNDYAQRLGYENLSGVVITKINPRSKMAQASVRPGTLIMSVNRQKVSNVDEFYNALSASSKNKNILLFIRYGKMSRYITINMQ